MNYNNQKILLVASEIAYKKGQLTTNQFLKILDDIEANLIKADHKLITEEVHAILEKYANS